ncbi:3-deoxy-7-phosphoheptulonate synthase [Thiohalomonas denitrificans]|uniref:3-deoxy-D-arabinoheptulosonate-7-phosphate synthase n=1 Tax=Thiohalomonas denitrificans TaxID=415747 RepID=A0A1G5QMV8_9GAMM|nr:3-deoxy-7-phosphoheptulonate synthase [Thiohalomonas denitrificans]SCZ63163.1 3-deoxy-D-arabinoheptulosonate-7-phosphate synthase [Thiohalomonas denitrificans]
MIVILQPNVERDTEEYHSVMEYLSNLPGVSVRVHEERGVEQVLTELYLVGNTKTLEMDDIAVLPGVERVVRVSEEYRILGRHKDDQRPTSFNYNGVHFGQDNLHVFAGLCAVDTPEHVEIMMRTLAEHGQVCTRMGAYKPRTSPYSFQGHGKTCLPYVFELAGKYGIKVIAMEITHESHVDEIHDALHATGNPTGVMLQIGTRNTQNFELLKAVGRQRELPVLLKRGFGITLEESLNAAEYLASEGNSKVIFALRGMKTNMGDPHRNFVDFSHVPVVKRLTRMPVCVDPSHSVGTRDASPDGLLDVMHVTAQGIVAGANMVLADFHPHPTKALVDGPQALQLNELSWFLDDVQIAREAYEKRCARAERRRSSEEA